MLKNPKGSPFQFFSALWDFFPKLKIFPPSIFWCFATDWMLENPEVSPFQFFGIVRHFENFFFQRVPPSTATKMLTISEVPPFNAPLRPFFFGFSIFEYCKLTLGSPFAIFEPRIWRRLIGSPSSNGWLQIVTCSRSQRSDCPLMPFWILLWGSVLTSNWLSYEVSFQSWNKLRSM